MMKWILLILFGTVGLGALGGGLAWAKKRYEIMQHGLLAAGTVVGQHEVRETSKAARQTGSYARSRTSYYPIVEFLAGEGKILRITGSSGGEGKALLATGSQVGVVYDPQNPAAAVIVTFSQAWLGPLVLGVIGAVFLLMAGGGFYLMGALDNNIHRLGMLIEQEHIAMNPEHLVVKARVMRVETVGAGAEQRYIVVCRGTPPGFQVDREYRSEALPFDPGEQVIGKRVTVYLDPGDTSRYMVEIAAVLISE